MTDDTPTQRIPETTDAAGELVEERQKSKALLFTLVGVGAALLIAIIVLLIILFGGGSGDPQATPSSSDSPSASPTPSDSPTPTESATPTSTPTPTPTAAPPPPPDTSPGLASFTLATQNVQCQSPPAPGGGGVVPPNPQVRFNYTSKNASSVWFVFGTSDAADAGAFPMPLSGNQDDVYGSPNSLEFPCYQAEQKYTITVVGNNGQHVSKTFTVKNTGYVQ
ncbi:hypothetical protein [Pseudolysinimonas sp.]|uniref:hypothetical protein n=1 Tax=Pseudolysinimonas sp. TaxID=2680009 RepID=UPI00286CF523|nr:hypothetical protein [Pseudolysinimonas sp.]